MNLRPVLGLCAVTLIALPAFAGEPCGDPAGGACDTANGTPGCDDAECCAAVCAIESACCDVIWDSLCVDIAASSCGGGGGVCGDVNSGDCYTDTGTPGCDNQECCELICALDPFCCETSWDAICATAATENCGTKACDIGSGLSDEGEDCGNADNNGCAAAGAEIMSTAISVGDSVNGVFYGYTDPDGYGLYDNDYYGFTISESTCLVVDLYAQYPGQLVLAQLPDCADDDADGVLDNFAQIGTGAGDCPTSLNLNIEAGDYYLIVFSSSPFSPVCGSGFNDYVLETSVGTDCGEPGDDADECPDALEIALESGAASVAFSTIGASESASPAWDFTLCPEGDFPGAGGDDVWYKVAVPSNATEMKVDTCDAASFDTTVVVYEGEDCASMTQVACSGDGTDLTGCQQFYSSTTHTPTPEATAWVRIGTYTAGVTGVGTLHVTFACDGDCESGGPADCPGDFNEDGTVGAQDVTAMLSGWGTPGYDLNDDGTTGAQDITALLTYWGACPTG